MLGDATKILQGILTELRRMPAVLGATIARRDGILIAHALPKTMDPKKIAAMAAAIVGTSEMAVVEMGLGAFNSSIVDTHIAKMITNVREGERRHMPLSRKLCEYSSGRSDDGRVL